MEGIYIYPHDAFLFGFHLASDNMPYRTFLLIGRVLGCSYMVSLKSLNIDFQNPAFTCSIN